jgi:hypothetical protein
MCHVSDEHPSPSERMQQSKVRKYEGFDPSPNVTSSLPSTSPPTATAGSVGRVPPSKLPRSHAAAAEGPCESCRAPTTQPRWMPSTGISSDLMGDKVLYGEVDAYKLTEKTNLYTYIYIYVYLYTYYLVCGSTRFWARFFRIYFSALPAASGWLFY